MGHPECGPRITCSSMQRPHQPAPILGDDAPYSGGVKLLGGCDPKLKCGTELDTRESVPKMDVCLAKKSLTGYPSIPSPALD
jgi:hypothetical protein